MGTSAEGMRIEAKYFPQTLDRNFSKIVAPPNDKNYNYVVHLKAQSLPKIMVLTSLKSANKRQRNACSNYVPLQRTELRPRSVTDK